MFLIQEFKNSFQVNSFPLFSPLKIKGAQQFDTFGKIFTVKVQYVFYKERPGIRPGQVSKAERLTSRLQQFAAYAIQGDYNGVKEFGSDLRKLGVPVEHAPHVKCLKYYYNLHRRIIIGISIILKKARFPFDMI